MSYYRGVDTHARFQQEVVFNARWLFYFSLLCLPVLFLLPLALLICVGELEFLHLDTPEIHHANIAVDERECCLDGIDGLACLSHPLISGSPGKHTDDDWLSFTVGSHYTIDYLINCAITAISNDEV